MRHIKNLDQWYEVPTGGILVYRGKLERAVEIELNSVGPCAVFVQRISLAEDAADPKTKPKWVGDQYFLGTFEGLDGFRWRLDGDFAVSFEPSGKVFARRDQTPLAVPNPDEVSYTRHEKAGLYVDELGTLLHRQSVLSRMANSQAMGEERRHNSVLEQRIAELAEQVKKLTPVKEETPPQEPNA